MENIYFPEAPRLHFKLCTLFLDCFEWIELMGTDGYRWGI